MKRGIAQVSLLTWVAGGLASLLSAIALAYASASSTAATNLESQTNSNTSDISLLKQSRCIENANIKNLAVAVKASYVSDPSCNNN